MTNKDLNLALDQNLIQPADDTQQPHTQPHHEAAKLYTAMDDSATQPNHHQNQQGGHPNKKAYLATWLAAIKNRPLPWLVSGLIVMNLLVLVLLVAFWLANQNNQATINPTPSLTESKTIEEFNQKLLTLQAKVEKIDLTLHEQQRLLATSSKDLSREIQQLVAQLQTTKLPEVEKKEPKAASKSTPKPIKETPKPVAKQPTNQWYVNIGTFSSQDAALRLKKQLLTLGHSVQVNTTSFDKKPAYRVQLPGFKDREAAESAARQIMEKTNLNGLWAWKDE